VVIGRESSEISRR